MDFQLVFNGFSVNFEWVLNKFSINVQWMLSGVSLHSMLVAGLMASVVSLAMHSMLLASCMMVSGEWRAVPERESSLRLSHWSAADHFAWLAAVHALPSLTQTTHTMRQPNCAGGVGAMSRGHFDHMTR